ncbi:sulfonate/nitrate ABC transporter, ATP-binding protein [Gottschalkia acidurici 9a]|uniref:Sulfonate/nitrate ABC transporter, ATP-binding protein n=1 Tax=Gottschalkia acidurici (strain ATCC 7906 / DSM 604 / BCRC 14475 / CIP 104303 / KCTC 5404 / NCIMB 10678 / 9a) TaxID=1128398 RepID=K0AYH6_GOTA9|nr:ABC transporter ATP-binding protein [Gottschalkia acidurici]AFS77436.1 sulfonate/nitrate ABC transporter, ATP-binding protein [Gottschalkia acidurici 9a]
MVLVMDRVYKDYGDIKVLKDMSFGVNRKEIFCVLGPSGCGKSTILNLISGLISPDIGLVKNEAEKIGYVFQEDRLIPWKTVYENIQIVGDNKAKIINLIDDMDLKGFENKYPRELSGGMRQRCSIARAFNYNSELLLMDEPFKSLDYNLRISMINHLINIWVKSKNSIVFVTHEIDEALLLGNRIMVLSNRPTSVKKIFNIGTNQTERKLNDKNLNRIRNEIIEIFITQKEEEYKK